MSQAEPHTLAGGRYFLSEPIGEGGMAVVYRAYDRRLAVWRAIKVLNPKYSTSRRVKERFDAEAQTMALLEHPNIVRVYDVGSVGDVSYIVMELVQGGSLVDWLEHHGAMPPGLALSAIDQVCHGVSAAHAKGVIHRDLKPHNVLVTLDGTCRITDFGIARVGDSDQSKTKTGAVMGTWGYMAPEQRNDAKGVDERADVYALAATLFTLVTNRIPMDLFAADRDKSMFAGVPPDLFGVLTKATEYHRENRYRNVEEFRLALVEVASRLPADPPGTPSIVSRRPAPMQPPAEAAIAAATPLVEADTGGALNPTLMPSTRGATSSEHTSISPIRIDGPAAEPAPTPAPAPRPARRRWIVPVAVLLIGLFLFFLAVVGAVPLVLAALGPSDPGPVVDSDPPEPVPAVADVPPEPDPPPEAPPEAPPDPRPTPIVRPTVTPDATPDPTPDPTPAPDPTPDPTSVEPPDDGVAAVDPPPTIVEVPKVAQCLEVQPVAAVTVGGNATFAAKRCVDDGTPVTLWYRPSGGEGWLSVSMPFRLGMYRASVKVDERFADGMDYYVETPGAGFGTRSDPRRVGVR
jgi:serine/threonine protein kinase